ncbi:MAG: hypothetical protein M3N31_05350 [Actinomycetota bacterium]|nr:hypothetical protein [Actinomycetota bacterium]
MKRKVAWLLRRSRASGLPAWVAAMAALALLGACGSDGDRSAGTTTTAPAAAGASTGPEASTTTVPPTCPTGVRAGPASPDQASQCLYVAWKAGDRGKAEVVASADAVESLFRQRWSPPEGHVLPCFADAETGAHMCSYDHGGAVYVLDVRPSEGGWRVTQVQGPLHGE